MPIHADVVLGTKPEHPAETDHRAVAPNEDSAPTPGADGGAHFTPPTTSPRSGKKEKKS